MEYLQWPPQKSESIRVFPLSNWTELDIWQYIYKENIPIPSLYFAKKRPVIEYMGAKILVDDERMPKELAKNAKEELVRFRTLGCYPLTGAINSNASNVLEIIEELLLSKTSERQGRLIDTDEEASMEKRKRGVFLMQTNIEKYLQEHENKELCRFITCGSVDDGKSTLIGRMLYDSKMLLKIKFYL